MRPARVAVLRRDRSDDDGAFSVLSAPGLDALEALELPWRDNRVCRSCIPAGRYEVTPRLSPRFGRVLHVLDVPDRSYILFHSGNLAGDIERRRLTHSQGCLLPGLRRGVLAAAGRRQRAVLQSRPAMRRLMAWAGDRPFILEIHDA